jgi:hypothetical protein
MASGCLAILIFIAAQYAWHATAQVEWPYDPDLFRDMATAQNILQGDWFADPYYAGETLWYNPLVPAIVAASSRLTGTPLHIMYSRGGVFLNLVVPITFCLFVWRTAGRWPAVAALFISIFCRSPYLAPWASGSYSPWLFSAIFSQALFYTTLIGFDSAFRSGRLVAYLLAGSALGLTVLAHTAPALLVAGMVAVEGVRRLHARDHEHFRTFGVGILWALGVAAVISLPLTVSVVGRYHLHVLNPAPAAWSSGELSLDRLPILIRGAAAVQAVLALAGAWWLISDRRARCRGRLLLDWLICNAAWLAWASGEQLVARIGWSIASPVPDYHWLFYWRALLGVLAGCGGFALARTAARVLVRLSGCGRNTSLDPVAASVTVLVIAVLLPWGYHRFESRFDFRNAVAAAKLEGRMQGRVLGRQWITTSTSRDSVFLASDEAALSIVGPAGRKTVAVGPFFSNPFVDRTTRVRARTEMLEALRAGDQAGFCRLCRPFGVTHVVLNEEQTHEWTARISPFLAPGFEVGDVRIWRVTGCRR